jgi:DNA invertase Pin-like site-specific DNA recombinase
MSYDGYIRVSSVGGRSGESFISPEDQLARIERWAKLHDVQLGKIHRDFDETGGKMERPGMDEALARIKDGSSKGIVVAKISRFGRTVVEALLTIKAIEEAGGEMVSVDLGVDTSTGPGRAMLTVMLAFAEMELTQIKENWRIAKKLAVNRGVWPGLAPLGYSRTSDRKLVPNADAQHVRRAFDIATTAGYGVSGAVTYLRDVLPDRQINLIVVEKMLANRLYIGEMRYGDFFKHFPELDIVQDRTMFDLAQQPPRTRARRTKLLPDFPLAGIATCGSCTGPLTAQQFPTTRAYRCRNPECSARVHIRADLLDSYVLDAVRANPPTVNYAERAACLQRVSTASKALDDHMAKREAIEAIDDPDVLDAWEKGIASRTADLAAAQEAAQPERTAPLDLDGDPRAIFDRAVDTLVVHRGRGPLTDRVALELH